MAKRRSFLKNAVLSALPLTAPAHWFSSLPNPRQSQPVVLSTWKHGVAANEKAWQLLKEGYNAIDCVEEGVKVSEADPEVNTVGLGGIPDRQGEVSLDACIMDENGNAGSVGYLQEIVHAVSVARKVKDETPHIMLTGQGAQEFALKLGFSKQNLLTEQAKKWYQEWKNEREQEELQEDNANHDTIGMLALDEHGDIAGACTTSGLAWKYHGRVGDSPIIGHGLYVDNKVGAACATGKGEAVMKTCGSFLVVEQMRNGLSPQQACKKATERIADWYGGQPSFQVGFLSLNKEGKTGAYSLNEGFKWAQHSKEKNELTTSEHLL